MEEETWANMIGRIAGEAMARAKDKYLMRKCAQVKAWAEALGCTLESRSHEEESDVNVTADVIVK